MFIERADHEEPECWPREGHEVVPPPHACVALNRGKQQHDGCAMSDHVGTRRQSPFRDARHAPASVAVMLIGGPFSTRRQRGKRAHCAGPTYFVSGVDAGHCQRLVAMKRHVALAVHRERKPYRERRLARYLFSFPNRVECDCSNSCCSNMARRTPGRAMALRRKARERRCARVAVRRTIRCRSRRSPATWDIPCGTRSP